MSPRPKGLTRLADSQRIGHLGGWADKVKDFVLRTTRMRVIRQLALVATAVSLALAGAGCGDGDDDDGSGGTRATDASSSDPGCDPQYPLRATENPPGYFVACLSPDLTTMRVRNVSDEVLLMNAASGVSEIQLIGVDQDFGVRAALQVTGYGTRDGGFVLPLGSSAVASGPGPVAVNISTSPVLTAEANMARYAANVLSSYLTPRGPALARTVQSCATSAAQLAQTDAYIQDVLREAVKTYNCSSAIQDAFRTERNAAVELPRIETAIAEVVRPIGETRLISFAANVLRH